MIELERSESGAIAVARSALARLVVRAAEEVDGVRVRRRRGVAIELAGGHARVSVELSVRRGEVVRELARAVQERVAAEVGRALDAKVDAVDVSVEGVFP